jgi:hypothetical protein
MKPISTSHMPRIYLALWVSFSLLRAATSERSCGVSLSPCPSGCWNPTAQVQPDGLRICEIVSPGFYSPDNDDAQYACETNRSACNPCPKQGFLRGNTGCSFEPNKEQVPTNNSTIAPAVEEDRKDDKEKKNNQMSKFIYALIFSLLMIGCIYLRARIVDCRTRQKNRRTRPIPPPPTDPKPKTTQTAVAANPEDLRRPTIENSAVQDIEQG